MVGIAAERDRFTVTISNYYDEGIDVTCQQIRLSVPLLRINRCCA